LVDFLADGFPCTRRSSASERRRARVHPRGAAACARNASSALDAAAALSTDLAVLDRQAHHRSGVVVLLVLAAVVSGTRARPESARQRLSAGAHLHRRNDRFGGRRLAFGASDQ